MAGPVSFRKIPVSIMERLQAGQEERLVEIQMETALNNNESQPRGSGVDRSSCFKFVVVLATVMGLMCLILVTGFIIYYFMFIPSCRRDDAPRPGSNATEKLNITCQLQKSDEQGRYDIFTAEKDAKYLIYGWVRREGYTEDEVILKYTLADTRTIQKNTSTEPFIFFFNEVRLLKSSRISLFFTSPYIASTFHVYELD